MISARGPARAVGLFLLAAAVHPFAARGLGTGEGYSPSKLCAGCHPRTAEQHLQSQHERSFTNPVFQAQYFEDLLPKTRLDPALVDEARRCIACHAPIAFAVQSSHVTSRPEVDPRNSGVTCDLCHTITGYRGPEPRDGNYVSAPSDVKRGPLPSGTDWHRAYSELHTKSELCATCHEATNHRGVAVKSTYSEWKRSTFAASGIQCQDCHMTRDGFLTGGHPRFESGKAAETGLVATADRGRLSTHRFPGAHSRSQVEGAITLALEATPRSAAPGERVEIRAVVDNTRTGHKMPTGSTELRLLWLTLQARSGAGTVVIPARPRLDPDGDQGVAGRGRFDARILGDDVPKGSRVYRAVFLDASGNQTLTPYDAATIAFDNRLEAGERRVETYVFTMPKGAAGEVELEARLQYLPYPTALTRWMQLPSPEPVEVASARGRVTVR